MIEKYIETYKIAHFPYKLLKTPTQCSFLTTEPRVVVREEKRHHTSRTSDEEFIKQLMISVKKSKGMKVILKADTNGYIISEI